MKDVEISIIDLFGRRIKDYGSRFVQDKFKMQLDATDLAAGIYFLELRANDSVMRRRMVIE